MNASLSFVEASQRHRGKADRPDAIVDFFEGHIFAAQGGREKQRLAGPRETAVGADEPDLGVPGIVERGQPARQWPARGVVLRGRRLIVQRLMRPLVVVLAHRNE